MFRGLAGLVSVFALTAPMASPANASVMYEVFNPTTAPPFVFFTYDSPGFITTDTLVPASSLAFNNSVHPATFVDFVINSAKPGFADVQVTIQPFPPIPTVQNKYIPPADLAHFGTYQFASGSFGYPSSYLRVVPEPSTMALLATATLGLLGLARRRRGS